VLFNFVLISTAAFPRGTLSLDVFSVDHVTIALSQIIIPALALWLFAAASWRTSIPSQHPFAVNLYSTTTVFTGSVHIAVGSEAARRMQIRVRRSAPFSAARPILNIFPHFPFLDRAILAVDEASIFVFGTTLSVCSIAVSRVRVAGIAMAIDFFFFA